MNNICNQLQYERVELDALFLQEVLVGFVDGLEDPFSDEADFS